MAHFDPEKLHVRLLAPPPSRDISRVRYTLTHSDATGDLFLSLGQEYDRQALKSMAQRFMRDEVLAEWCAEGDGPVLQVHCHVSGGFVLGGAAWRFSIFRSHIPQVLQAFRYGDQQRFTIHPELDQAEVQVYFHSSREKYNLIESWGVLGLYRLGSD